MDFLTFILGAQAREVSATVVLVGVVVLLLTGRLLPLPTHKREIQAATDDRDAWRAAHDRKEAALTAALQQNSNLLAAVRIADKFYSDFIPVPDERTTPKPEVPNVG